MERRSNRGRWDDAHTGEGPPDTRPRIAVDRPSGPGTPRTPRGTLVEWVGARLSAPFYVTEGVPHRPDLVLWLELPDDFVVAVRVVEADGEPHALAETLRHAFREPLIGPPRRPGRIRVASSEDAEQVRQAAGGLVEVVVAPVPEVHAVLERMAEELPGGVEPSYLEDGRVPAAAVERMFRAARFLFASAPWKGADDQQTLRLDIPALGVEGACVSVIGALGQSRGLIIFPSHLGFESFVAATERYETTPGPLDMGTTTLSLTFEPAAELPTRMRREALEHGWEVAGPDAYPCVQHRDRDGVPRPLDSRDVRIATACATAVGSFAVRHPGALSGESVTPHSETYTGEDGMAVRLTTPYDALDLFEPEPSPGAAQWSGRHRSPARRAPPPVRRGSAARPRADRLEAEAPRELAPPSPAGAGAAPDRPAQLPGRNEACWCGSGKKYKRCHFHADQAAERTPVPPIHETDERLVRRMAQFASERFGERWASAADHFADARAEFQLFAPWAVYHYPVGGRPIVEWFLEEHGRRLSPEERDWLRAQRGAWLGVWEVTGVTPGRGLSVHDLLTGERREVTEIRGSQVLRPRDAVLGRVVEHGGMAVFGGIHPRPLAPIETAEIVASVRRRVRRRRAIPVERLREPGVERHLIARWDEAVAMLEARALLPPQLRNTDGDELLFTTDHFAFDRAARETVAARLAELDDVRGPEPDDREQNDYTFVTPGSGLSGPGDTIVGVARLGGSSLRLETNSLARADRLRRRLEEACGELLRHRLREHASPFAEAGEGEERPAQPPPAPPPEVAEALREWIERHYASWMDEPLPALGGQTPRAAARTGEGRERVNALLKMIEHRGAEPAGPPMPDVARMRRELGIEDSP